MEAADFDEIVKETEVQLERLKNLYEQYFQGIQRLEPSVQRRRIDRVIRQLNKERPRNTASRFRFNALVQKFTSYRAYWGRTMRQIEEGTYRPHVMRARQLKARIDARKTGTTDAVEEERELAEEKPERPRVWELNLDQEELRRGR